MQNTSGKQSIASTSTSSSQSELEKRNDRLEHVNRVLVAIRNINQLIVKEKDRDRLLNKACRLLAKTHVFYNCWITLVEDGKPVEPFYHAGFNDGFAPMAEQLRAGQLPHCARLCLEKGGVHGIDDPSVECNDCPLTADCTSRSALTIRLEYEDRVFGWLTVSISAKYIQDIKEQGLLTEVADDLAFALHGIEMKGQRLEQARRLASRYEFQVLLTGISAELMQRPLEEIDAAIENALGKVGSFAGSDRCYIFLFSDDGRVMNNTHEWCAAGSEPQKENLQGLLSETFPWWMDKLRRFEYIHIPQVAGLAPEASAEKEILEAQDIQSVMVLPMANQGRLTGYFGLDWVRHSVTLDDDLIALLQLAGDILFGALNRARAEKTLRESEKKFRLLADNTIDFIWTQDMNLNLTYGSPSIKRLTGYTPEEYAAMSAPERYPPETWKVIQEALAEELEIEERGDGDPDRQKLLTLQLKRKSGGTVWVEVVANIMRDDNARPVGIVGVSRDITERRQADERLRRALDGAVSAIGHTVEYRDPYTAGHQKRVAALARAIALEMELPKETVEAIHIAGVIHDLGKIAVPAEILTKPGILTKNEFNLVMEHPSVGYNILKDLEFPWDIARMVHEHHEKLDGSGYPQKLVGEEILLESMILAVADVVEAMATHRPYRPALGIEKALEEISLRRGELFHPDVVDSCVRLFRDKQYTFE